MTYDQVRTMLLRRAQAYAVNNGSSGVNGWCEAHSAARAHVNEFLNAKRDPPTDLLDALGLEWRIVRKR